MTWWNRKSRPEDEPEVFAAKSEEMIPCDRPEEAIILPQDPEPDLATKPEDIVGYCFGYACPKKHTFGYFDSITLDGYKSRKPCQECGGISKPAVIKRTAEAQWGNTAYPSRFDFYPKPEWRWYNSYALGFGKSRGWGDTLWTSYEFVHYLNEPKPIKKHKIEPKYEAWLVEVEKRIRRPLFRTEMCAADGLYTRPSTAKDAAAELQGLRRKK